MLVVIAALAALALVPIGGASLASRAVDGIGGLWSSASPPPQDPAAAENLAEAVTRWNAESSDPAHATGAPLLGGARDLVRGLGTAGDTITAFPTRNGAVCYEIRAAGSCGRLDNGVGVVFGIHWERGVGARLFGVASDEVTGVEVEVDGVEHPAIVENNAVYYELPPGKSGSQVNRIVATWRDGSVHPFDVHPLRPTARRVEVSSRQPRRR